MDIGGVVLDEAMLDELRKGYQPAVMKGASRGAVAALFPPGAPMVATMVETVYSDEPISGIDRERCLIALLAARGERLLLAIHLYWGLMEGLGVEEAGHTLLMVYAYHGIPAYTNGLLTLQKTCGVLAEAAKSGEVASPQVLQRLMKSF